MKLTITILALFALVAVASAYSAKDAVEETERVFRERLDQYRTPIIQNLIIKGHEHYGRTFTRYMDEQKRLIASINVTYAVPPSEDSVNQCRQYRNQFERIQFDQVFDDINQSRLSFAKLFEAGNPELRHEIVRNEYVDDSIGAYALCEFVVNLQVPKEKRSD